MYSLCLYISCNKQFGLRSSKNIIVFRVKVLFVVIKETTWPPYKMNVKAVISRLKIINTYNMECVEWLKVKSGPKYILDHSHVIKSKKWKWAKGKRRPKQWTYSRHCDKIFHGLWRIMVFMSLIVLRHMHFTSPNNATN